MSTASDIYNEFISRAEQILTAAGYQTDAGRNVYHGKVPTLNAETDTMPAICIFEGDQQLEMDSFCEYDIRKEYRIECYVLDDDAPADSLRELIEDVQAAVEQSTTVAGQSFYCESIEREMPNSVESVARALITYIVNFRRAHGTA